MSSLYFDNAATSYPKPEWVKKELLRCLEESPGNPGRSSHRLSLAAAEKIYSGKIKAPSQDEQEELDRKLWEKIDTIAFFNEDDNYQVSKHLHALNQLYWASTAFQKGLSQTISSEQEYIDIAGLIPSGSLNALSGVSP